MLEPHVSFTDYFSNVVLAVSYFRRILANLTDVGIYSREDNFHCVIDVFFNVELKQHYGGRI